MYCDKWKVPPHVLNEVAFKVVCESVAEAAYLAEVREERTAATPHKYQDKGGRTMNYVPVGDYRKKCQ